ncbi:MAG: hypothetical protein ACTHLJ_02665 [Angustibacter sp.]
MRRKSFDTVMSWAGVALAALLLVAGGLLTWAHTFVSNQVHSQLSAQQIYFPKAGDEGLKDPKIGPFISQYAGQQLTDGAQARAYADHYIAVHIEEMAGGKTYAQLSNEARANPDDAKAQGLVATVFKGETLRGLLLNAYAFWMMGQIALYAAIAAFVGGAGFAVLAALGFVHRGRVSSGDEVFAPKKREPAGV